jgi:uncharacterized protein YecE (DUF72 family)
MVSMDNICFPPLENESSSLKANSMQLHVVRLCRGGRWYLYLAVPQRPKKSIQRAIPWLQGYEEIVLFFDNDEAGRKATEEAASVLQPGKTKIARLEEYKDASDALQVE